MHFYSFNIKEYHHATVHLTAEEDLCYRRLLDMAYDSEKPLQVDGLARKVRMPQETVDAILSEFFVPSEDGWQHTRVQAELEKAYSKSEKARESAKASHAARERKANAMRSHDECTAKAVLPNTQNLIPNTDKKEKGSQQAAPVFPGVLDTEEFRASWNGYMTYRRQMKFKTLKSASVIAKFQEMESWGHDLAIEAIKNSIRQGWQGIFPPFPTNYSKATPIESEYADAF